MNIIQHFRFFVTLSFYFCLLQEFQISAQPNHQSLIHTIFKDPIAAEMINAQKLTAFNNAGLFVLEKLLRLCHQISIITPKDDSNNFPDEIAFNLRIRENTLKVKNFYRNLENLLFINPEVLEYISQNPPEPTEYDLQISQHLNPPSFSFIFKRASNLKDLSNFPGFTFEELTFQLLEKVLSDLSVSLDDFTSYDLSVPRFQKPDITYTQSHDLMIQFSMDPTIHSHIEPNEYLRVFIRALEKNFDFPKTEIINLETDIPLLSQIKLIKTISAFSKITLFFESL